MSANPTKVGPLAAVREVGHLPPDDVVVVVRFENDAVDAPEAADERRGRVPQIRHDSGGSPLVVDAEPDGASVRLGVSVRGIEADDAQISDRVGEGPRLVDAPPRVAPTLATQMSGGAAIHVDGDAKALVQSARGGVVIAVGMTDEQAGELARVEAKSLEARFDEARGGAAVHQDGGAIGGDQGGVSRAAAGQGA